MLFGLVQRRHHLRVLHALCAKSPQRFNELRESTGLEATQLSRVIDSLAEELLIITRTLPAEGERIPVAYRASNQGRELMALWERIHAFVHADPSMAARSVDEEMEALVG